MEVEEETFPSKKKLHVNAASLVDLKAALYRKQQEARNSATGGGLHVTNKKVSDKTASIWRRDPKKSQKGGGQYKSSKGGRAPVPSSSQLTPEEEVTLARSKAALEAKAKLYDRLTKSTRTDSDDEEDNDDDPRYMVDFQRKVLESNREKSDSTLINTANKEENQDSIKGEEKAKNSDEEWVEYTDSLGRSRRCMKKDLNEMKRLDREMEQTRNTERDKSRSPTPELLSADMRQERERREWERNAYRETEDEGAKETEPTGPVHYQNVKHNEVRSHGVGYYAFSVEEEKRQSQIKTLNKLRDDTIDQRAKREQLRAKRQAILEAKLARVKERKLKQGGDTGSTLSIDIADFDFESKKKTEKETKDATPSLQETLADQVAKARERAEEDERAKHVRPWDKGKVADPLRKRKQQLRDERPNEFAPPATYKKSKEIPEQKHSDWIQPPPPPPPPPTNDTNAPPLFQYPHYPPPPPPPGGVMFIPQFVPAFMYPPPPPPPPPPSSS